MPYVRTTRWHGKLLLDGDLEIAGDIVPDADNVRDIGESGNEFKDLHIDGTGNIDSLSPKSSMFLIVNTYAQPDQSTAEYMPPVGTDDPSTTEGWNQQVMPCAGTLKNLRVVLYAAPGTDNSWNVKSRINGADGNLTVTIADDATSGQDLVNTDVIAADDKVSWLLTPTSTPNAGALYITAELEPS